MLVAVSFFCPFSFFPSWVSKGLNICHLNVESYIIVIVLKNKIFMGDEWHGIPMHQNMSYIEFHM